MIMSNDQRGMNNQHLDTLIREIGENVDGDLGFWEFTLHERRLCCITDEAHDRIRVMTPIADVAEVSQEQLVTCLEANFDRALDARYCLHDATLWGAFIHPLNSLHASLFRSACSQVAHIACNFGESYSSGVLRFGE